MYLADLTPCGLWEIENTDAVRAVGWLEPGHDYSRGGVPEDVVRSLVHLLVNPWQPVVSAGVHRCSFCRFTGGPGTISFESTTITVGASNVFVPGEGVVYAAPSLIVHYMDAHEYAPPPQFQRAVLDCPPMRSMAYLKAIRERSSALVAIGTHRSRGRGP